MLDVLYNHRPTRVCARVVFFFFFFFFNLCVGALFLRLCQILDVVYNHRPIQRFWFLETVARMPYLLVRPLAPPWHTLAPCCAGALRSALTP